MAIDTTLTKASGLERVGDIEKLGGIPECEDLDTELPEVMEDLSAHPRGKPYEFSVRPGYWDMTWIFSETSPLTLNLREVREVQAAKGMRSEDTRDALRQLETSLDKTGIFYVTTEYAWQFENCYRTPISHQLSESCQAGGLVPTMIEGLLNGIEHGSVFGTEGPVKLHLLGGKHGILFSIDDPGNGFDLSAGPPANGVGGERVAYSPVPTTRNNGTDRFERATYAKVNGERTSDGFAFLTLYEFRR